MKRIAVLIDVPDDWESRLDMQPFIEAIEAEIKADRWSWVWASEPETPDAPAKD